MLFKHRFLVICLGLILSITALSYTNISHEQVKAQTIRELTFQNATEIKQLKEAKSYLKTLQQRHEKRLFESDVSTTQIGAALVASENAKAYLGSTEIAIADVSQAIKIMNSRIEKIKARQQAAEIQTQQDTALRLKKELENKIQMLVLQRTRLKTLNSLAETWQQIVAVSENWYETLLAAQEKQERNQSITVLLSKVRRLQSEQNKLFNELGQVKNQANQISANKQLAALYQFQIYTIQEKITLNRLVLFLTQLQVRAQDFLLTKNRIEFDKTELDHLIEQMKAMQVVVSDRIQYIDKHISLLTNIEQKNSAMKNQYQAISNDLVLIKEKYNDYLKQLSGFENTVTVFIKNLRQQYRENLYQRESLPGLTWSAWKNFASKLVEIPQLAVKYIKTTADHIIFSVKNIDNSLGISLLMFTLAVIVIGFYILRYLKRVIRYLNTVTKRFSQGLFKIFFKLIKKNFLLFIIAGYFVIVQFLLQVDLMLIINILLVIILTNMIINVVRSLLVKGISEVIPKNKNAYYRLRAFFIASAILLTLVIMTHQLPVDEMIRGIANRLSMLILLFLSLFLFKGWVILPLFLQRAFCVKKNYVLNVIRLFCRILPVTLFSNALVGLLGYVQLAWLIGVAQFIALVILFSYLLVRGLAFDFMELCYELTLRYVGNGWIWTQVILKPLDKILRLAILAAAIWALILAYHLNENQAFIALVSKILTAPLIKLGDNLINIKLLIKAVIFVAILYWVAKWSREFCFRSLYVRARDIGVRNSLSVFTQYSVVILGVVVGLKFLGVDLKGVAVIAAAFAAGIGFGLRDLLNNFFSGILLLFERPFRSGDFVTLGQYEGEIMSTGMRSMKIRTWDHMEVIVPNADLFTKPFVNWTHQDSIVRTVVMIRLDRVEDPHFVQELIYKVLNDFPLVVDDPEPEVFMKELSESLLEMQVRYYINLQIVNSRARVRSEVLFAIWDCFKQHNIHPPYPHFDMRCYNSQLSTTTMRTTIGDK